jgi:hypothetical protein
MKLPKEKHVHIFDFDETLCRSNGVVKITDKKFDCTFYLSATEYSNWREKKEYETFPGRFDMDFSDFTGYPLNGVAIKGTVTLLKILLLSSEDPCVLVTGRDELSGPRAWLLNNEIDVDKMILMCSGNPNKRMAYESVINTLQPLEITVYEDSLPAIKQCEDVCKKYDVRFHSKLIVP